MDAIRSWSLSFSRKSVTRRITIVVRFLVWLAVMIGLFFGPLSAQAVSPTVLSTVQDTTPRHPAAQQETVAVAKSIVAQDKTLTTEQKPRIYTAVVPVPQACQKIAPLVPAGVALIKPGVVTQHDSPQYYQVHGTSLEQIRAQLKACSPNGYFGYTAYRLTWEYYTSQRSDDNCHLVNVAVGVHTTVQYPEWLSVGASTAVKQRWDKMMSGLTTHEQGHAALSEAAAQELYMALISLPPAECKDIHDIAGSLLVQHSKRLQQQHVHYDEQTDHGATQGAVL